MGHQTPSRISQLFVAVVIAASCLAAPALAAPAQAEDVPDFKEIADAILRELAAKTDYRSGDLISKSDVQKSLDLVEDMGWTPKSRSSIEDSSLDDGHFLVRQLRTKRGRPFMRRVSQMPGGFDRLDRLSKISGGRRIVADLIRAKGGSQFMEYLSSTPGGANLGRQLNHAPGGRNFNKPTNRVYTAKDLLKVLQEAYEEELEDEDISG